jgi:hypothetical protein
VALTNAKRKPQASEINMSDMRRLIESMDKISEATPKGLQRPGLELGPEMGGGGGAGGGARLPTLTNVVKPAPPAVWRNPRTGQTSSTPPGTTVSQPLPPGVTPSTAGAGRGTTPVTQPTPQVSNPAQAKPRIQRLPGETPAQAVARAQAATPKSSATTPVTTTKQNTNQVGQERPGGERDTLGRREPGTGTANPFLPPREKPLSIKKPAAAAAAIGAGLYLAGGDKKPPPGGSVSTGTVGQSSAANGQPQVDGTSNTSKVEIPTVGPQGENSPFYVLPGDSEQTFPLSSPIAPNSAPSSKQSAPKPSTSTSSAPASGKAAGSGTGSGTGSGSGNGTGDGDSIETRLRKAGYIDETAVQKLLNDFTKFIESSTKNKSKVK